MKTIILTKLIIIIINIIIILVRTEILFSDVIAVKIPS